MQGRLAGLVHELAEVPGDDLGMSCRQQRGVGQGVLVVEVEQCRIGTSSNRLRQRIAPKRNGQSEVLSEVPLLTSVRRHREPEESV